MTKQLYLLDQVIANQAEAGIFRPGHKLMALSWKQPYADMMLHGKVETRTWSTKYRGWVLICASKKAYTSNQIESISGTVNHGRIKMLANRWVNGYELVGFAIGIGRLVDCRPMKPEDERSTFVKYYPNLFCHVYENVQAIQQFPWKGTQGWKEVSDEVKQQIKLL